MPEQSIAFLIVQLTLRVYRPFEECCAPIERRLSRGWMTGISEALNVRYSSGEDMEQSTHKAELPALPEEFVQHVWRHAAMAGTLVLVSLAIGVIGFRISEPHPGWIDSYLNAAMLLGGMGPIDAKELSPAGRVFEATYALYCGLVFVVVLAIMLKPFLSRVIRKLDAIHLLHTASLEEQTGSPQG